LSQLKTLQEQIEFLTQQNSKLQAQLKEAWSVQPATADPQELAKAQHALMELQKERDLLKTSLEDAKSKKPDDMSALDQERKILAEVRQQLSQQIELVGTLQKENELLKTQMTSLKSSVPNGDLALELEVAKTTVAALQATNVALLTENFLLQSQLAEAGKGAMPPPALKELERERDELRKKLEAANKQLARRKGDREPDSQFQAALARLEVYESKPVPYTPEELALFKQPDLRLKMSETAATATRKKPRELPPGAGPLMAQAQRAMEAGR